jgi:predicted MFS family arabinose efflux permease
MEDLNWSKFQQVLEVNTNRLIFAQSLPGCIAWSSIATFMPDFLHKDLGFSVKASTGVMAVFGISGLVCALVGSGIGQAIFNKNRKDLPIFVAICICAGAIPMVLLALFGGTGFITILLALFGGVAASAGPNLKGMLMNANSNDDRGSVFSLFSLVDNVGKGLGPSVLVMLTWILGGSRRLAFAVAFGLWFVSAWIAVKLSDCLNEDTLTVEIKQGNSEDVREPFDLLHVYHS